MRFSTLTAASILALICAAPAHAQDASCALDAYGRVACSGPYRTDTPPPPGYYGERRGYQRAPRGEAYPVGPRGACPRGYTIQHGRCEPYRGR